MKYISLHFISLHFSPPAVLRWFELAPPCPQRMCCNDANLGPFDKTLTLDMLVNFLLRVGFTEP